MHMKMQIKYKNAGTLFECCHTTEDTQRPTFQERSQKTTMRWNESWNEWQFFQIKLRMECGGVTARTEGRSNEYNFYNSCRRTKREARLLVLICLPSGIKLCAFCTPQTGVPHGTPPSLVAHSPRRERCQSGRPRRLPYPRL